MESLRSLQFFLIIVKQKHKIFTLSLKKFLLRNISTNAKLKNNTLESYVNSALYFTCFYLKIMPVSK